MQIVLVSSHYGDQCGAYRTHTESQSVPRGLLTELRDHAVLGNKGGTGQKLRQKKAPM